MKFIQGVQRSFVLFIFSLFLLSSAVEASSLGNGWSFLITGHAVDTSTSPPASDRTAPSEAIPLGEFYSSPYAQTYSGYAGMTPDSSFYFVDRFFDVFQSSSSLQAEKLGEMTTMLMQGNYVDAGRAADAYASAAAGSSFSSSGDAQGFAQDEYAVYTHSQYVDTLKQELVKAVDSGELTADQASASGIDTVQSSAADVQSVLADARESYVEEQAAQDGVTRLEEKILLEESESSLGLDTAVDESLQTDIPAAGVALAQADAQIKELLQSSEMPAESKLGLEKASSEIQLHLDAAQQAKDHGLTGEAYAEYSRAQDMLLKVDGYSQDREGLFSGVYDSELHDFSGEIDSDRAQREESYKNWKNELDSSKDSLQTKYPAYGESINWIYGVSADGVDATQRIDGGYQGQYNTLIQDGKTADEAQLVMEQRTGQEYQHVYGDPYIPPGFTWVELSGAVVPTASDTSDAGIYVQGYGYTDPATGYDYSFSDSGYTYTTPFGDDYTAEFTVEKDANGFQDGSEEYSYVDKTPAGDVRYDYTATGYSVTDENGQVQTYSYPEGDYKTTSGDGVKIDTFGFTVDPTDGGSVVYQYNPEYKNYVSSAGTVYVPPHGASVHEQGVTYAGDKSTYNYVSGDGATWTYAADSGQWKSSDGKTYVPPVTSVAPTGHEGQGRYVSDSGKVWNYDTVSGQWAGTDPTGQRVSWGYDSKSGTWTSAEGAAYNPAVNYYTNTYNAGSSSGLAAVGASTTYNGETYTVTADKGWTDSKGNAVAPPPGQPSSVVGASGTSYGTQGTSYGATGTNRFTTANGVTWTREANGAWSSSNGEGYVAPTATYGYSAGGTGTSGGDYRSSYYSVSYSPTAYAAVGTSTTYNGQTYTVTSDKGWTDAQGNAVAPPPGQVSSGGSGYAAGGSYGYSYGCANGACGGGTYYSPGTSVPADGSGGYGSSAYGSPATYGGYGYSPSYGTYGTGSSGSYYGGSYGTGGYGSTAYGSPATYGGYSSGGYSTDGSSGTSYSGTSYSSGSYSSGSYSGGDSSSGSYSGSSSGSTGGDSGGSSSSSSSGGSSGGDSGGGGMTGYSVYDIQKYRSFRFF
ncbi:hypothetical protein HZA98_03030 [Candidatus Woesearchaeota archaeon]|nr:hypothetical protein [Candidatus Woesearchaeota archaeon]